MNAKPARNSAKPAPDAALAKELASLPGPLKAQLVVEFLGLNRDGLSDKPFPQPAQKDAHRTNPSQRLIHGILAELARELELRKKPSGKAGEGRKPAADPADQVAPTHAKTPQNSQGSGPPGSHQPPQPKTNPPDMVTLEGEHPIVAACLLSAMPTEMAVTQLQALAPKITLCLSELESGRRRIPSAAQRKITAISNRN